MLRREFLKKGVQAGGFLAIPNGFFSFQRFTESLANAVIDSIELFRYDIDIPRYFSWGTWYNRQHVFMKISSGNYYGWSEIPASKNNPDFDLVEWSKFLRPYKHASIREATDILSTYQVNESDYSKKMMEFIEFGLLDLFGRIQDKPAIDMLQLQGANPIPGLFCILDKDINKVKVNAKASVRQNLSSHMKVKMYGDIDLDMQIVAAAREIIGMDAMIMSDANQGYKQWNLQELSKILIKFHKAGLDALEDPATLDIHEWIELQKMVDPFSLIPDYVMGPSWESIHRIKAGMGKLYNIHPSRMGSIKHAMQLAAKVKSFGAGLMIGDDSLVGPACTIWQQLAIGTGASWVEAIEKEGDSADFLECVVDKATTKGADGNFSMKAKPGFGLEMDEDKLKNICHSYVKA